MAYQSNFRLQIYLLLLPLVNRALLAQRPSASFCDLWAMADEAQMINLNQHKGAQGLTRFRLTRFLCLCLLVHVAFNFELFRRSLETRQQRVLEDKARCQGRVMSVQCSCDIWQSKSQLKKVTKQLMTTNIVRLKLYWTAERGRGAQI